MARARKTWREKLEDSKDLPKIVEISGGLRKTWGQGTAVIPAPLDVDGIMKKVRKGRVILIREICDYFARHHAATIGCPITTGIFAGIAAKAADEAEKAGRKRITPYWRTLRAGGELNAKYPGGIENIRARLEAEGHVVLQKGKRFVVEDFEGRLVRLS